MNTSKTGYGVDVSAKRADELEKRLLMVVQERVRAGEQVCLLDLGCGAGGAAARLADVGATVTGVDIHDFSSDWSNLRGHFIQGNLQQLTTMLAGQQFDYCLCNRTMHYLPYAEAAKVLVELRGLVREELYISFSGITSELAHEYDVRGHSVETRHAKLSAASQETFGIAAPITLYSEAEAIALMHGSGWKVTWSRTTDFGNALVVASVG